MVFKEYICSVLVVSASDKFNTKLAAMLPPGEFYPIEFAESAAKASRKLSQQSYGIVIVNTPLPDEFGLEFALDTAEDLSTGVLLLVKNDNYDEIIAKVRDYGILVISKPVATSFFYQALRLIYAMQEHNARLYKKTVSLEDKMEEIRLVNKAKWALIGALNMTEEEAHKYIEKQAMDRRVSRRHIAESIIKMYN